jgi:rhodanese-related sulfurtransferase
MQASELLQRIESNRAPLVIDARSEIEFKRGHIKGALNVPVRKLLLHTAWLPPDKEREVVVTCEHGQRAAVAKGLLSLYGFHNTEFLEGFLEAWKEAGLPLETGSSILATSVTVKRPNRPRAAGWPDYSRLNGGNGEQKVTTGFSAACVRYRGHSELSSLSDP